MLALAVNQPATGSKVKFSILKHTHTQNDRSFMSSIFIFSINLSQPNQSNRSGRINAFCLQPH